MKASMPKIEESEEGVPSVLFMNPSAAWMVSMIESAEELEMCLDQLSLKSREIIFIPVNDSQDPSKVGGGSHWSLLLFQRASNTFYYFDSISSGSNNKKQAEVYAKNLYPVLHVAAKEHTTFKVVKAPSQKNGFDCGVFTVSFSKSAYEWILSHGVKTPIDLIAFESALQAKVSQNTVSQQRKELLALIDSMTPTP